MLGDYETGKNGIKDINPPFKNLKMMQKRLSEELIQMSKFKVVRASEDAFSSAKNDLV